MTRLSPKIVVIIGVIFSSLSSIFVRSSTAPAIVIALYRMWFSVFLLMPLFIGEKVREHTSDRGVTPRRSDYLLCVASGVFLAFHFWLWFESLGLTTIASATVLVDTHPIFVLVVGFLVLRERVTRRAVVFVGVAIAGMAVLSFGDLSGGSDPFIGDMLAVAGAAAVAGYMIIGRIVRQRMSSFAYVTLVYLVAAITLTVIALISGVPLFGYSGRDYLIFLGIAFFCTLLGHTLFNWALKFLKTSFISMIVLTEPLYATVLGMIIFSEVPALGTFFGGAVVLLGVFLFVREEGKTVSTSNFDKKAKEWDANPMQIARNEAVSAAIRRMIPLKGDMRTLDFGAGTGLLSLELAGDVGPIVAVDTSEGMLTELEKKLSLVAPGKVTIVNQDLTETPLDNGPFDLVFTVMALHHVDDVEILLDRFSELLDKDGFVAIAELYTEDGSFHGPDNPVPHHGFDPAELAKKLESRGISAVEYEQVFEVPRENGNYPVFLLTGQKK